MAENHIINRMRELAADHEKFEQGGGASMILNEGAEALIKAFDMLERLEWGQPIPATAEHDSGSACPVCGQGAIFGLRATHADGCELAALLKELGA